MLKNLEPAVISKPKKPVPPAHLKIECKAKMMRIYISEEDRWRDKPLDRALVEAMRANNIAGVNGIEPPTPAFSGR